MRRIKYPVLVRQEVKLTCRNCGEVLEVKPLKAGELLAQALEAPRGQGYTLAEMDKRMPIVRALLKDARHVDLEDAHWELLKAGVDTTQWLRLDEDTVACCHAVKDAELLEVEVAQPGGDGAGAKAPPRVKPPK